jgi:putative transcriptional regulator
MDVANPKTSRAVLIGASTYQHLTDLPAVPANLADLRAALIDRDLWGLPPENVRVIADEKDPAVVYDELRAAARATAPDGLLLYYYAGHGLIDTADLVLGLPGTDPRYPDERGLQYNAIRRATRLGATSSRVVILDCCYAGRAGRDALSAGDAARVIADRAETENVFLLLAVGPNAVATAPSGERHTAFTGALLNVFQQGSASTNHVLTIKAIAAETARQLRAAGHEPPQLRMTNEAADIPLIRNVRVRGHDLTGTVLRADPRNTDVDLRDSQILVLRHNETGTMGVRLNRPGHPLPANLDGWRALISPPHRLFDGGPIAQDTYIALVRLRPRAEPIRFTEVAGRLGSMHLTDQSSADPAVVAAMRIFTGYLGWGPGHLEQLIKDELMWIDPAVPAPRATFATGPWS